MPLPIFATSAPYVVTILVAIISWTLVTFRSDMSNVAFLQAELERVPNETDAKFKQFTFRNVSPKANISNVTLSIKCKEDGYKETCFAPVVEGGDSYASLVNVAPWALGVAPIDTMQEITQRTNLPVDMSFTLEFRMANDDSEPVVLISSDDPAMPPTRIVDGCDLELFVTRNFLLIVLVLWGVAVIVLVCLYRRTKNPAPASTPEVVHVKIIQ